VNGRTNFLQRNVTRPVLQLLRIGATPERLAWSIAVGIVVGVNPLLGSTTVIALTLAPLLGLNLVASQLGNHLVYPLELLLFPVFIRMGCRVFGTAGLPLELHALLRAVKRHPWDTTRLLWSWEWHALVVWAAFAVVVTPVLQWVLCPVLRRMLDKLHHEPVVEK
jgi:uncharacterized protein (DUF2062 family)